MGSKKEIFRIILRKKGLEERRFSLELHDLSVELRALNEQGETLKIERQSVVKLLKIKERLCYGGVPAKAATLLAERQIMTNLRAKLASLESLLENLGQEIDKKEKKRFEAQRNLFHVQQASHRLEEKLRGIHAEEVEAKEQEELDELLFASNRGRIIK